MTPHTILKDFHGSQTGHDNHHFKAGTIADLSRSLAEVAVLHGLAEPFVEVPVGKVPETAAEPEEKSQGDAPANKMKKGAPENKGRN